MNDLGLFYDPQQLKQTLEDLQQAMHSAKRRYSMSLHQLEVNTMDYLAVLMIYNISTDKGVLKERKLMRFVFLPCTHDTLINGHFKIG